MYTEEYLLEKLKSLWLKHGKIQGVLIDKEPDFPTRKCYVDAFGSLENACKLIGYNDYKKGKYTIDDAQKVLDERNGHFDLLDFNGMRNKATIQCRECKNIFLARPDNLLRNKNNEHYGCASCNNKKYKNAAALEIIKKTPIRLSLEEIKNNYPVKDNIGYVYEIYNLTNHKKYIGSTINPYNRWKQHINSAFNNDSLSYNYPLQLAIRKYGVDNFSFNILYMDVPLNDLPEKEKEMIIAHNTCANSGWGYNQTIETECALRDENVKNINGTPCALVDEDNNILKKFNSYHEASRMLFGDNNSASKICAVCHGKRKSYHKMKFINI